jgi:hypothetical protein
MPFKDKNWYMHKIKIKAPINKDNTTKICSLLMIASISENAIKISEDI